MGGASRKLWTSVPELIAQDDRSDTRYELIDGRVEAMAPSSTFHGNLVMNLGTAMNRRLETSPPCRPQAEAGVQLDDFTLYIADVAVTCAPPKNTPHVVDPLLFVELLPPSTKAFDLLIKVKRYIGQPSVQEVWLVDSERRSVQLWVRSGDAWVVRMMEADESFVSPALEASIGLDAPYRNVELERPAEPSAGSAP